MANTITLRGLPRPGGEVTPATEDYTLGDLTLATHEDFPEAVNAFFTTSGVAYSGERLKAVLTLGAEAVRRGSHPGMTREQFRELVQLADLAALYVAVGRALGSDRGKAGASAGEAPGPEGSRPSATSSGA